MRRDVLEYDTSFARAEQVVQLGVLDAEAIRLVLSGGSVLDWQRLAFENLTEVDRFLGRLLLDPHDTADRERLRYVFNEAVSYLEEHLRLRFPADLRNPDDVRQVFLIASDAGGFRRRQILACVILKLMHVIHHMEAADLKFRTPVSEALMFDLAERSILQRAREMREAGLAIVSFYGSRKSRSSILSKLLAKKENLAATVFDKLRFRIVVESRGDILPVMSWLYREAFPFNYVIPGQSHNNLLDPDAVLEKVESEDREWVQRLEEEPVRDTTAKNEFSGSTYRAINFIVDWPVRLPGDARDFSLEHGRVVFVMVEFQILDEETMRTNEEGENAHFLYKERQARVIARRLRRGAHHAKGKL